MTLETYKNTHTHKQIRKNSFKKPIMCRLHDKHRYENHTLNTHFTILFSYYAN